ncbi:MAG: hypothetical protein Tsb005_13240 [Gammaproteobacteria bacterium]
MLRKITINNIAWLLAIILISLVYANLRLQFSMQYPTMSWEQFLHFTGEKPFILRILIPLLLWPIVHFTAIPTLVVLFAVEWLATIALCISMIWVLRYWLPDQTARWIALGFITFLPLNFLWVYHFYVYFLPYDTPAILFVILGIGLVIRQRWGWTLLLMIPATLNRESAILIPAMTFLVWWRRAPWKNYVIPMLGMLVIYILIRSVLIYTFRDAPNHLLWFNFPFLDGRQIPRILANLLWLSHYWGAIKLLQYLLFLPLLWLYARHDIPSPLNRVLILAMLYLGGLMLVANLFESRVLGEVIGLGFVSIVVGCYLRLVRRIEAKYEI